MAICLTYVTLCFVISNYLHEYKVVEVIVRHNIVGVGTRVICLTFFCEVCE